MQTYLIGTILENSPSLIVVGEEKESESSRSSIVVQFDDALSNGAEKGAEILGQSLRRRILTQSTDEDFAMSQDGSIGIVVRHQRVVGQHGLLLRW